MNMNWRAHTEVPIDVGPTTALLAVRDPDDGEFFLIGIYEWKNGKWIDEDHGTGIPERYRQYWWILESDLLQAIARR